MKPLTRLLLFISVVLLSLVFVFPLWKFEIWAPQYPEGLFMQVWISKITGDVRNVNILNHYVGMHPILEESLPELKIFPWIFGGFALSGLAIALGKMRRTMFVWVALLFVFATVSLADFYLWEKKFGTELNPDAPIKMDETYQPPLIGKKNMMNIEAWSLPGGGAYALTGALALAFAACLTDLRARASRSSGIGPRAWNAAATATLVLPALLSLTSCTKKGPEPIQIGADSCNACRMVISDSKFGVEIITSKGKVHKFDSLECMTGFLSTLDDAKSVQVFVPDSANAGKLIAADSATFGIDPEKRGPMGRYILASGSEASLKQIPGVQLKEILTWAQMTERLKAHLDQAHNGAGK